MLCKNWRMWVRAERRRGVGHGRRVGRRDGSGKLQQKLRNVHHGVSVAPSMLPVDADTARFVDCKADAGVETSAGKC